MASVTGYVKDQVDSLLAGKVAPFVASAAITASTSPVVGSVNRYNASGGALTPALPALSGLSVGARLVVEKDTLDSSANTVTVSRSGSDMFDDGSTQVVLRVPGQQVELQVVSIALVKRWKVIGQTGLAIGTPTAAREAIGAERSGVIRSGVKGGAAQVLRRRDLPPDPDKLSPYVVTATITAGSSSTIASAREWGMSAAPSWCTLVGGQAAVQLAASTTFWMMNWRSPNGGEIGLNVWPNPFGWGIEFELQGAAAFEAWVRPQSPSSNAWYQLLIDGRRVWDVPQSAAAMTPNASNMLKFTTPDAGTHRYRLLLNNLSLRSLFTSPNTIPTAVPLRGPRIFMLGNSLDSIGGGAAYTAGGDLASYGWRLAEMLGCGDFWPGGEASTGYIANAGGGRTVTDGAITSGSTTLTSATAAFTGGDASRKIEIVGAGAGGATLQATITSVTNDTTVVISTSASTTVTNAWTQIAGTAANFVIRALSDVVPAAPDILIIGNYHNDKAFGASAIADALTRVLTIVQTALPNTMIIVVGAWDPSGTGGAAYTTIDTALRAVCMALGVPYIETANTGTVYDGNGNSVAVQGKWIDTATKNMYTCADNTHQTDAGMKYMAHRAYHAIRALLPA